MTEKTNPAGGQAEPGTNKTNTCSDFAGNDGGSQGNFNEETEQYRREAEESARQERERYQGQASIDLNEYKAGRLIDADNIPINWVFLYSLMERIVGFIVGAAGAGKSQWILQAACSIVSKILSLVGFDASLCGKVVYFAAEDDVRILQKRLKNIISFFAPTETQRQAIAENLIIIPGNGQDWRFLKNENGNPQPSEFYLQLIEDLNAFGKIALLIIDPMARFYGANENDNSSATMFVSLLERLKEELQATVLCVHHIAKGNPVVDQKSLDLALHQDAARGASALTGAARWQMNIAPIPGNVAKKCGLICAKNGMYLAARVAKNNYAAAGDTFYMERSEGGILIPAHADMFKEDLRKMLIDKISSELLLLKKSDTQITKKQFGEIYITKWKEENNDITKNAILGAIEAGLIQQIFDTVSGKNKMGKPIEYLILKEAEGDDEDVF